MLDHKLNITHQIDLAKAEEKISKQKAMQRGVVKDVEIKTLLKAALSDQIADRALFMAGIDVSDYDEGYSEFKTEELSP